MSQKTPPNPPPSGDVPGFENRWRELQAIFDSVPAMVWFKDGENRILGVNAPAAAAIGRKVEDVIGRSCDDLFPEEAARYLRDDREVMASGVAKKGIVEQLQTESGEKLWIRTDKVPFRDETGAIVGVIVFTIDITESVRIERSLRESEQRFRTFFEASPDAIFVEDLAGKVLDANPAACSLHGLPRAEIVGGNVRDLVPPHLRAEVEKEYQNIVSGEQEYAEGFSWHAREVIATPVELRATHIDYNGQPALLLHVRDITKRKRAEEALRESNRQLEDALGCLEKTQLLSLQQARLHALGHMASGIAHDFNNALSPIIGFSELLLAHPEYATDRPRLVRYLDLIRTAALDASNVVRNLREFYRHREVDEIFHAVDLSQLVLQTITLTQPRWKDQALAQGITIKIESQLNRLPMINGNEAELREALINLIFNAVDAMPAGGTLRLSTTEKEGAAWVEIRDTGIGMSEEERLHCLEPFFSTKGERGTGLGLAMVYGILRRHHATIEIASARGEGTTCTVRFPLASTNAARIELPPAAADAQPLGILVVEDEELLREVLTEYLRDDGHRVTTAVDGSDGLEKYARGQFDLVITDRAMPGLSGDQLAAALRQLDLPVKIIMLTGFGDMMRAAGETCPWVDLVLSKPLTFSALRDAIRKVMTPVAVARGR